MLQQFGAKNLKLMCVCGKIWYMSILVIIVARIS